MRLSDEAPSTLQAVPLGELVVDLQSGFARRPSVGAGTVVQLRTNNINVEGWLDLNQLKMVVPPQNWRSRYGIRRGDILLNNTNSPALVGKAAFAPDDLDITFSNHISRLRVDEQRVSARYLAHFLTHLWRTGRFKKMVRQWVNQAGISATQLRAIRVPLPRRRDQQERAADVLDEARSLVKQHAEQNAKHVLLSQATYEHFFGRNTEGRRKWPIVSLGDSGAVEELRYGTSLKSRPTPTGSPTLRIPNVLAGEIDLDDLKYTKLTKRDQNELELRRNDILVVRTNGSVDNIGRAAAFLGRPRGAVFASYLIRVRPVQAVFLGEYLAAWLNGSEGREQVLAQARTTAGQYNLSATGIRALRVPCAPRELQQSFVAARAALSKVKEGLRKTQDRSRVLAAAVSRRVFDEGVPTDDGDTFFTSAISFEGRVEVELEKGALHRAQERPVWQAMSETQRRVWECAIMQQGPFSTQDVAATFLARFKDGPPNQKHLAAMLDLLVTLGVVSVHGLDGDTWQALGASEAEEP
jgi:type I restriction enzyme S subunit